MGENKAILYMTLMTIMLLDECKSNSQLQNDIQNEMECTWWVGTNNSLHDYKMKDPWQSWHYMNVEQFPSYKMIFKITFNSPVESIHATLNMRSSMSIIQWHDNNLHFWSWVKNAAYFQFAILMLTMSQQHANHFALSSKGLTCQILKHEQN